MGVEPVILPPMLVIAVCAVLVLAGLAAALRWGGLEFEPPAGQEAADPAEPPSMDQVARRYLWNLNVAVISGVGAGILAAGAGGRLVMRLLAVTAGPAAQGRVTEAEEVVGRITVDGTLGFVVFIGLFAGLGTGLLYLLVRRWLPKGRAGGPVYGALLLVLAGTRLDPLRPGNPDFDLVGPGWLSVAAFTALAVFHGVLVAALAARLSRVVPLLGSRPRAFVAYAPLLLLLPLPPAGLLLAAVGVTAVLVSRVPAVVAAWRDPRMVTSGRIALVALAVLAFPGFASAVVDILGRP
jgi:hypothetical protein